MSHASFSADFTKLTLAKQVKIEIILPEDTRFDKIAEIAKYRGARINVVFGNPQIEMDFDESEMRHPAAGLKVSTDASGVVQSVEGANQEAEDEPDHEDAGDAAAESTEDSPEDDEDDGVESKVDKDVLEAYILEHRPVIEGIDYNFAELLEARHNGKRWIDIAQELNVTSSKIQADYGKYKRKVAKLIKQDGAA